MMRVMVAAAPWAAAVVGVANLVVLAHLDRVAVSIDSYGAHDGGLDAIDDRLKKIEGLLADLKEQAAKSKDALQHVDWELGPRVPGTEPGGL